jgi:tetratricopeptide (TPR) repeat protein
MSKPPVDSAADLNQGLNTAMRAHQAGDVATALALYETLLMQAPEHPTLRNFLGMAQIQLRRFNEGEANLRRALLADPAYAEAWNSLGNLYRMTGRPEEALGAYLEMTRLAPSAVTGWINLADLYRQMHSSDRAQLALAAAVRLAEQRRSAVNCCRAWRRCSAPGATVTSRPACMRWRCSSCPKMPAAGAA